MNHQTDEIAIEVELSRVKQCAYVFGNELQGGHRSGRVVPIHIRVLRDKCHRNYYKLKAKHMVIIYAFLTILSLQTCQTSGSNQVPLPLFAPTTPPCESTNPSL
jgi:hypothetical protein